MSAPAVAVNENPTLGRLVRGGLDTTHGAVLYLEDISVSFDGFKALNRLSLSCLLYTSPSPRDRSLSRMPSSA